MKSVKKPLTNIVMFTNLDIVDSTVSSPSAIQMDSPNILKIMALQMII